MNSLYYSDKCQHCTRLMAQHNLPNYQMVNIDNSNVPIPPYITMVPTIVTSDQKNKYEGKSAFSYVQNTTTIEPYAFSSSNNTNQGFSFIHSENQVYCEQTNYSSI